MRHKVGDIALLSVIIYIPILQSTASHLSFPLVTYSPIK